MMKTNGGQKSRWTVPLRDNFEGLFSKTEKNIGNKIIQSSLTNCNITETLFKFSFMVKVRRVFVFCMKAVFEIWSNENNCYVEGITLMKMKNLRFWHCITLFEKIVK